MIVSLGWSGKGFMAHAEQGRCAKSRRRVEHEVATPWVRSRRNFSDDPLASEEKEQRSNLNNTYRSVFS